MTRPHDLHSLDEIFATGFSDAPKLPSHCSLLMAVIGWALCVLLALTPLVLGCRPMILTLTLMILLNAIGLLAVVLWLIQSERPVLRWYLLIPAILFLLIGWVSLLNPAGHYDTESSRVIFQAHVVWLPHSIDVRNALPDIAFITGLAGTLLSFGILLPHANWRRRFLLAAVASGAVFGMTGILQKCGYLPLLESYYRNRSWAVAGVPFGLFDYHGNAGSFLNIVLCFSGILALSGQKIIRIGACVAFVIMCAAQFLNISRTATLLMIAAFPLVIYMLWQRFCIMRIRHAASSMSSSKLRRIVLLCIVIASCLFVIASAVLFSPSLQRFRSLHADMNNPWYARYMQYRAAYHMIQDRPVWGSGPGSYRLLIQNSDLRGQYFAPQYHPGESISILSAASSDYLELAVDHGLAGLLMIAILPLAALAYVIRSVIVGAALLRAENLLLLWGLGALLIHAAIDCPVRNPAVAFYAVLLLALCLIRPENQSVRLT